MSKAGTMQRKVRWGVLGTARIAKNHVFRAIREADSVSRDPQLGRGPHREGCHQHHDA